MQAMATLPTSVDGLVRTHGTGEQGGATPGSAGGAAGGGAACEAPADAAALREGDGASASPPPLPSPPLAAPPPLIHRTTPGAWPALLCSPRCRHTRELGALTCTPHDSHSPGRLPRRSRPSSSPTSTLCPLCSMRTMTGPRSHPCICRSIYRAPVSWTTLWAARGRDGRREPGPGVSRLAAARVRGGGGANRLARGLPPVHKASGASAARGGAGAPPTPGRRPTRSAPRRAGRRGRAL